MNFPERHVAHPVAELRDASKKLDAWVVTAWWHGGHWKCFPELFASESSAQEFVERLPCGWTRKLIFKLEAPAGGSPRG